MKTPSEKYQIPYDVKTIIEQCPDSLDAKRASNIPKGSRVLEFGPAAGYFTKFLKEELECSVSIVELDAVLFNQAIRYAEDGFLGNIETFEWADFFKGRQFDVILFNDVLEHLRDPDAAITRAREFLTDEGTLMVSIPNIAHASILINLLYNFFNYTDTGLLDSTHTHFWGFNNIFPFFEKAGYKVEYVDGTYMEPESTEQHFINVPKELRAVFTSDILHQIYQFLIFAKKTDEPIDKSYRKTVCAFNPDTRCIEIL